MPCGSGIPDHRGPNGLWRKDPEAEKLVTYGYHMSDPDLRRRSWRTRRKNRTLRAEPNAAHRAVADRERTGIPVVGYVDTSMAKDLATMLAALAKLPSAQRVADSRLLDVAQEKGIEMVVANRMGAVGKIPDGVKIFTRMDLQVPTGPAR